MSQSPSRDLNTGPADYKSAALPAKPLGRHIPFALMAKKTGDIRNPCIDEESVLFHYFLIELAGEKEYSPARRVDLVRQ
jgi:hypothetical protein